MTVAIAADKGERTSFTRLAEMQRPWLRSGAWTRRQLHWRSIVPVFSRLVAPVAALVLALVLANAALAANEVRVPPLTARVTDLTGTLSAPQIQTLEQSLREFERRKGSQVVVLMVPTVKPETIEEYSIRVADAWKIGRTGVDDGIILVIAKDDHQLRIEVGRGLEGAIPDVIAKRVIREVIAPHFLANDFYGGIAAGTNTLMKLIDGEPLAPVNTRGNKAQAREAYESLFVIVLVLALVLGRILSAVFGRALGSSLVSAIAGGAAWLITGALIVAVLAAIAGFIFTLVAGSSAGRFLGGGYGGGWPGGGWSGGGGFSGGGGGFGGGGASGRW